MPAAAAPPLRSLEEDLPAADDNCEAESVVETTAPGTAARNMEPTWPSPAHAQHEISQPAQVHSLGSGPDVVRNLAFGGEDEDQKPAGDVSKGSAMSMAAMLGGSGAVAGEGAGSRGTVTSEAEDDAWLLDGSTPNAKQRSRRALCVFVCL